MWNVPTKTRATALVWLAATVALAAACGGASARTAPANDPPSKAPNVGAEPIPTTARRVVVSTTRFARRIQGPVTITSRRAVSRAVALLNGLPAFPRGVYSCPADFGVRIRLAFFRTRTGANVAPLAAAVIDPDGCGEVQLTVSGRHQAPRAGSRALVSRLSAVLHLKLETGPP